MQKANTISDFFRQLQQLEGHRLALLRVAEMLEMDAATSDLGPARRPLRSNALFDTVIPDDVVWGVIATFKQQARELEAERDRLFQAPVTVKGVGLTLVPPDIVGAATVRRHLRAVGE